MQPDRDGFVASVVPVLHCRLLPALLAAVLATACGGGGGGGNGSVQPPGGEAERSGGGPGAGPRGGQGGNAGTPAGTNMTGGAGTAGTGGGAGAPAPAAPDAGTAPDGSTDASAPAASGGIGFDPPGGTFKAPQALTLTNRAGAGAIHYTQDGSLPSKASPVYQGPIMLAESTLVRAFVAGAGPAGDGPIAASVYLRLADDLAGFSSNLPVVVLHTHKGGSLPVVRDGPRVPGSMMIFEPRPAGTPQMLGPAVITSRAGLRIRGGSSLRFPQKSYGVELYHPGLDEDDDRAFLGWPSSSDYALIGASRADRSLMRNALAFTLSAEIGRYAPRVRFVEAFLVENNGPVAKANYLGVFTLAEKIKQGKTRVAVAKLEATDLTAPAVTGGYVVRIDEHETHFTSGGLSFNFVSPAWANINVPARQPQRAYMQGYLNEFFEALGRPDFKHPRTGKHYNQYIDVPAFLDHNILNAVFKNVDGLRFSAYFHKDRDGLLVAGPLWDFDRSSGTRFDDEYGQRASEPREWARGDGTHFLRWNFWGRLYADPAFKAAYQQRWATLSAAQLSVEHIHGLIDKFAAELREAQTRHFARWPELPPSGGSHDGEVKILKDFFTARVPWMTQNL